MAKQEIELTENAKAFCHEFLGTNPRTAFNGTEAYQKIYKCSRKAAESGASRLLRNAKIQAYLTELRSKVGTASEVTLERTLQEIARVAFCDITTALSFDSEGVKFKDSGELPPDVTAAIASVSSTDTTKTFQGTTETKITYKMQLHNKVAALSLLADFFGIRDDFNKARASLKRYGLLLLPDPESPTGWRLDRVSADSSNPDAEAAAIDEFTEDILADSEAL